MSQVIGNGSQLTINRHTLIDLVARVRPGASHACILGANSGDRYLSVLKMSASTFQLPPCCFFQTTTYFPGVVNYRETETGDEYWISGPRRDGLNRLYGKSALVVEIDEDVREEYWTEIRKKPEQKRKSRT
jgi:hypothetical protein